MARFLVDDPSKQDGEGTRPESLQKGSQQALYNGESRVGGTQVGRLGHSSAWEPERLSKASEGHFLGGSGRRQPLRDPSLQIIVKRHPRQGTVSRK